MEKEQETAEETKPTYRILNPSDTSQVKIQVPRTESEVDDKPEEEVEDTPEASETTASETPETEEYDEEKVRLFFKAKGREVENIDDLFAEKEPTVIEKEVELPEHITAYKKYYEETGRSVDDFVKLNRNFDDEFDQRCVGHDQRSPVMRRRI